MLEVGGFVVVALDCKMEEVAGFLDGAEEDVLGAVVLFGTALLDLFEVAGAGQGLAFAYGEGAIGKVDEHFAALQMVLGNGLRGVAFWGVGQHQYGAIVFGFDGLQAAHKA